MMSAMSRTAISHDSVPSSARWRRATPLAAESTAGTSLPPLRKAAKSAASLSAVGMRTTCPSVGLVPKLDT